jgi:hypothetical protein
LAFGSSQLDAAWAEACRPGDRLTRGGAAAHLKPVTRLDLVRRYGQFLGDMVEGEREQPKPGAEFPSRALLK